jgi:Flp pilus assembly protein TadD
MSLSTEQVMEEGHLALAMGEMGQAAEHYRQATQIDPSHAEAWQSLGMALVKLEILEEAILCLKRLIELRPKDQLAYSSLSLAFGRAGKIKEAEEMAAKAKVAGWGGDPTKIGA